MTDRDPDEYGDGEMGRVIGITAAAAGWWADYHEKDGSARRAPVAAWVARESTVRMAKTGRLKRIAQVFGVDPTRADWWSAPDPIHQDVQYVYDPRPETLKVYLALRDRDSEGRTTLDPGIPIEELGLSTRSYNVLTQNDILTVRMLLTMSETELLGLRNCGRRSLEEMKWKLVERGFVPRGQANMIFRDGGAHADAWVGAWIRPPLGDRLNAREREVLELRRAGATLAQIGRRLGVSGERVRQIESGARES